jgi:hypothetical protein
LKSNDDGINRKYTIHFLGKICKCYSDESHVDSVVFGRFPAITVQNGYRFKALVGCMDDMTACDATFRLKYADSGGVVHTLGSWQEAYEGMHTRIDVDLSSLAGQQVEFILEVSSNGSSYQDKVFWMTPHIVR